MVRRFGRPFSPVAAGPPKPVIHEESLPEPQMIKQTWLEIFFEACQQLAELNCQKGNKIKLENAFKQNIESLFTMMAMKQPLKGQKGYTKLKENIINGQPIDLKDAKEWLFYLGDALQELGPLKIEYVKSVSPEDAWREGELLGED